MVCSSFTEIAVTGVGVSMPTDERMRDPVPFPTEAQLAMLEYQTDLGPAAQLWDRTWTEIRAAAAN